MNPSIRTSKKLLAEIRLAKIYFLKWTDTRIHGFLPLLSTANLISAKGFLDGRIGGFTETEVPVLN